MSFFNLGLACSRNVSSRPHFLVVRFFQCPAQFWSGERFQHPACFISIFCEIFGHARTFIFRRDISEIVQITIRLFECKLNLCKVDQIFHLVIFQVLFRSFAIGPDLCGSRKSSTISAVLLRGLVIIWP